MSKAQDGVAEFQVAIDLLTTNETYFWREARHFELAETLAREAACGTPRLFSLERGVLHRRGGLHAGDGV